MNEFMKENFYATTDKDVALKKVPIKGKIVLKILALIMEICFFLPMITVSCSGQEKTISGLDATFGTEVSVMGYTEKIDGNMLCILLMVIPLAILAVLFVKKMYEHKFGYLMITAGALVQAIILFQFKSRVIKIVEEEGVDVVFHNGYYINLVFSIIVIILSLLMYYLIYQLDIPVNDYYTQTSPQMPQKVCSNCGVMVNEDARFCGKCGQSFAGDEESYKKAFCSECGSEMNSDMSFCPECGTSVNND